MQNEVSFDPMHIALKYVAATCIDEGLTEDAEILAHFLDLIDLAPRTVGLLQVWILSQKGQLRDALRHCQGLVNQFPEAEEFQPVLAVLGYSCNEQGWRNVCTKLLESPTASEDNKTLVSTLLDGTFGTPAHVKAEAEAKAKAEAEAEAAASAAQTTSFDYAAMGGYMRA